VGVAFLLKNKKTVLITYAGGSYGSFVQWALNYFSGRTDSLPFTANGNSHRFKKNKFDDMQEWEDYLNSNHNFEFASMHPKHSLNESVSVNLQKLAISARKIIALHYDDDSLLLSVNNKFERAYIEGYIAHEKEFVSSSVLRGWGRELTSLDRWELREFLSLYIFAQHESEVEVSCIKELKSNNLLPVSITDLCWDFKNTIIKMCKFAGVSILKTNFDEIYNIWSELQPHIHKDKIVNQIVNSVINQIEFDWSSKSLTVIDEALVQMRLRDLHNSDLKCYNVNVFPTNTKSLIELL